MWNVVIEINTALEMAVSHLTRSSEYIVFCACVPEYVSTYFLWVYVYCCACLRVCLCVLWCVCVCELTQLGYSLFPAAFYWVCSLKECDILIMGNCVGYYSLECAKKLVTTREIVNSLTTTWYTHVLFFFTSLFTGRSRGVGGVGDRTADFGIKQNDLKRINMRIK